MIEPLRFTKEYAPPYAIAKPVFCGICLAQKKTKNNPGLGKFEHDPSIVSNYRILTHWHFEHISSL